jgi:hypothetical protein
VALSTLLGLSACPGEPFSVFRSFTMAKISKPDANPVVALLLSLIWGLGHIVPNGQKNKFIKGIILQLIGLVLCCIPGWIIAILSLIDAYKTAVKLKAGKEIDENEYSFKPYYSIAKKLNKEATFVE